MTQILSCRYVSGLKSSVTQIMYLHSTTSILLPYKRKSWADAGRKKVTPRELALAYFDTYYPILYGEKNWEDMRHAMLLVKKKYCAVLNNFTDSQSTIIDMITEQKAYDMFTLAGKHIKVKHTPDGNQIPEQPYLDKSGPTEPDDEPIVVNLDDIGPQEVKYVETDDGFMIPTRDNPSEERQYTPPDLLSFEPATRKLTFEEEEMVSSTDQVQPSRRDENIVITPCDPILLPPMLKCYIHERGVKQFFPSPPQHTNKLLKYYVMDGGSILPVLALGVRPDDNVLDLCAGPGGKAIAILQTLLPDTLTCVDSSHSRLQRIKDTFSWYIPGMNQSDQSPLDQVFYYQQDGRMFGARNPEQFDKVLVDVPCSTDRHYIHEDENNLFKRSRVTERLKLPEVQTDLLISAIQSCKVGGTIVYSTCTLTPGQNDHVIESTINKLSDTNLQVSVVDTSNIRQRFGHIFKMWPLCSYGQLVLPTPQANFGPTYFCKLLRTG